MRILLVGDYPNDPRLGSTKVYYKLHEELARLGHDCDVLLGDDIGRWPSRSRVRWALGPVVAERAIARRVRERGAPYDVIDVASAEGFAVGLARRAGKAAYRDTALVSRSHGLEHLNYRRMLDDARLGLARKQWYRRVWFPLARMSQVAGAARVADRLLVLNERERDFAAERGWKPRSAIDVVPHGVSSRFLDEAPPDDAPRGAGILFCGSWDPTKGVPYLVDGFARLAAADPDARLTVLGGGPPDDVVLAAFPRDVRARVRVLGRVDEPAVMREYRRHDVLAFPSTYDGFGMVVLEAMSQGLPVVGTPVGCVPAVVRDGENGQLVPPRSGEALAAALLALLHDDARRRRMGAAAREAVRGMTWTATALATVQVYRAARQRP